MTTALETAFPAGSNWVRDTVLAKLAEAMIGVFTTPNLSAEDFSTQPYKALAIVGPGGDLELYSYDATDTTTADDGGVSCIVVSGRRYKKRIDVIVRDSALSATTSAQPASPALGDTYIVPAAPSGDDWASEAKTVATYTARGWIFREPFVGMVVYVEGEAGFRHYDAAGNWTAGMGAGALPDGSITPTKLFHPFAILKVVDQRNSPPGGTLTDGTMYQIGTSPTGAFASHSNKIARWTSSGAGSWEFINPQEGDTIYRLNAKLPYTFRSGAWVPTIDAAGVQQIKRFSDSGTFVNVVGPQRSTGKSLTSSLGKHLRFTILSLSCNGSGGALSGNHHYQIGIYVDAESAPSIALNTRRASDSSVGPDLGFLQLFASSGAGGTTDGRGSEFVFAVPDGAAHTYSFGIRRTDGSDGGRDFAYSVHVLIEELVILS